MRCIHSGGMGVASYIIMVDDDNGAVDVVKIYPDRLLQPQSSLEAQANILINSDSCITRIMDFTCV